MLELKNITKSFGDTPVLNGISLTLDKGRIMSILGPSGGGKTTLLNIILGITDATGGQKQRVALARTLVMKPRLLLLDEPLSALDGVIKESIKAKIKQIVDQYNLTTIMVTHDPEEACTMSDRVLILNQGRIAQYDTPENIIEHPASDFVRDFILHQLEVKRNNIYSLFSEDHAADPADPARANRRSSAPERSDPPCRSNPSRRASSCPTSGQTRAEGLHVLGSQHRARHGCSACAFRFGVLRRDRRAEGRELDRSPSRTHSCTTSPRRAGWIKVGPDQGGTPRRRDRRQLADGPVPGFGSTGPRAPDGA